MTTQTGFALIPTGAKVFAVFAFIAFLALGILYFSFFASGMAALGIALGLVLGCLGAGYVLLAGYVYGDARRRGMPPIAWTALAVLVPNALGFVIYFLLRKPILRPCSSCGVGIAEDSAFCPRCGQAQMSVAT